MKEPHQESTLIDLMDYIVDLMDYIVDLMDYIVDLMDYTDWNWYTAVFGRSPVGVQPECTNQH